MDELSKTTDFDLRVFRANENFKCTTHRLRDVSYPINDDEFVECYFNLVYESEKVVNFDLGECSVQINEYIRNIFVDEAIKKGVDFAFMIRTDLISENEIKINLIKI